MKVGLAVNRILHVILVLVIALSFTTTACQSKPDSEPKPDSAPQVGKLAPNFQLPDLEGKSVSLSDFLGSPIVVNFWASWCGPCVHEMPYIQGVYDEWSAKGLVLLGINIGESPSKARQFMDSNHLFFPVLLDEDGKVAELYSIRGIPTTIFIDEEGIVQVIKIGAFPSKAAIEDNLSKIIP